ncbi:uncharacterized protein TA11625 [Theileria annulata]|uniref:Uncharacterized protein n=1 Tax=Theileria annulata TaxID=5874 RepID=Q4UDL1_THEAN|nr:uncharacterized protein TA11625 [Theileria annulata]CAI74828.1 hypothetical protein TA11625 [Theileria annulata]|eukprot:XP_952560.1 hypothetical protein TA11625 [Theileria annulata]
MVDRAVSFVNLEEDGDENRDDDNDSTGPSYRRELSKTKLELLKPLCKNKNKEINIDDPILRKILLLQDILYEFPELETNLLNSISGTKQKPGRGKFFRLFFGLLFLVLMYVCIFILGLIVSSYLLSPIPITGTVMTNYIDPTMENDLQKIVLVPPTEGSNILKIRGSFKVSYNLYNNTFFCGALSIFAHVSYLPQSGKASNYEKCFGDSVYKYIYKYTYKNVKTGNLEFFNKSEYNTKNMSLRDDDVLKKKRFGSLITLEKVENEKNTEFKGINVLETTVYNAFFEHPLASNKIEIIPKISRGFNKVVILVTLETEIDPENEEYMTKRMLTDCKNSGFLTLKLDSSLQSFDTMLFSGNMLPTSFLPFSVPCIITTNKEILDNVASIAKNQRILYNRQQFILKKLNTSLNI